MERLWGLMTESVVWETSRRVRAPRFLGWRLRDGLRAFSSAELAKAARRALRAPLVESFRSFGERTGGIVRVSGTVRVRSSAAPGPASDTRCAWRRTLLEAWFRREEQPILGKLMGGPDKSKLPLVHDAAEDFDLVDADGTNLRITVDGAVLLTPAFPDAGASAWLGPERTEHLAAILRPGLARLFVSAKFVEIFLRDGDSVVALGSCTHVPDPHGAAMPREMPTSPALTATPTSAVVLIPLTALPPIRDIDR